MKLHLYKVRLNKSGEDSSGCYWGVGLPLFEYYSDDHGRYATVRAHNREHAKQLVKSIVPSAKFYR